MAKMGIGILGSGNHCKRNFRWIFTIPDVTIEANGGGVDCLPPEKAARPNIQFKETSVRHQAEDVYYPAKPDWKPVSLTLYDIDTEVHPVFGWIREFYIPKNGAIYAPNEQKFIKKFVNLGMYDGCGNLVENWVYEDAWLQSANFQTLDYGDSGIVMCDITMRYARAYVED